MEAIKSNAVMIGAGNLAGHLAPALSKAGIHFLQVYSRKIKNAAELAGKIGAKAVDSIKEVDQNADLYVIAVADDAIPEIASQLRVKGMVVHTSGSVDIMVLKESSKSFGVFYPLQSFSKNREINWKEIPICLESSDPGTEDFLNDLAGLLSGSILTLTSSQRAWVHLAAVFANNFTNLVLRKAGKIQAESGAGFSLLRPLVEETVYKAFDLGPENAQTGPAARGDIETIRRHLAMLEKFPETREIYSDLSNHLLESPNDNAG